MIEITRLYIYPVKSMRGIAVDSALATVMGLLHDRRWMVVNEEGRFLTQREIPQLAVMHVEIDDAALTLTSPTGTSFAVPISGNPGKVIKTVVWGTSCEGIDQGDRVAEWLTDELGLFQGQTVRLLRFRDEFRREVAKDYLKGEAAHTAFADGYPFLLTAEESLKTLNDHLLESGGVPVTMDRFRPNVVIRGIQSFQENQIEELRTPDGTFRLGLRKPCKRCKIITIDPQRGAIDFPQEPLRTLVHMNTVPGLPGAFFGQNATLLAGEGRIMQRGERLEYLVRAEKTATFQQDTSEPRNPRNQ